MNKKLLRILFPFLIVIPCCFVAPLCLGWGSSLLIKETSIYGNYYYRVDFFNWLLNYGLSFSTFQNMAYRFSSLELNFSGVINPFISIANCIICLINTALLPISLVSCLITVIMALVGFPLIDDNFIYQMFKAGSYLQIPYLNYV